MRLQNKVAVVTGVENEGIGQATAILFAEEGARVVVTDIDREAGSQVVAHIKRQGGEALFLKMDIKSEGEIKEVCEETVKAFGRLDLLVNNGVVFSPKGLDATVEDWQNSLRVNVIGTAMTSRHAAEVMKRQNKGAIVNVATISGMIAQPQSITHAATQAALLQMTREIAMDLAPHNIRVNCVCHGILPSSSDEHSVRGGRIGQPREVAYAILFLASDEASLITGTHLIVDGGYTAQRVEMKRSSPTAAGPSGASMTPMALIRSSLS